MFARYSALEKHIEFGKHTYVLEKMSLQDVAKLQYAQHLEDGQFRNHPNLPAASPVNAQDSQDINDRCSKGWALKSSVQNKRFTDKQKQFMDEKFKQGELGKKSTGEEVAKLMRTARDKDGKRIFNADEFLTSAQISSYFSRAAAKRKNISEMDNDAFEHEEMICQVTEEIVEMLDQDGHTVSTTDECYMYSNMVLCTMSKAQLASLKMSSIREICKKYEIEVTSRRKEPYVNALFDVLSNCPRHR